MYSISIGIPAYNEEANITSLLKCILSQREEGFYIKEVFVLSDGSRDKTVMKVKQLSDKRIHVLEDRKRRGKSYRVDQVRKLFTGDLLFLIDADILISDSSLFARIIRQSFFAVDGVVGVNSMPLPAKTIFEKIIEAGVLVMKDIIKKWRGGRNYLAYRGSLLAIDGALARQLQLKQSLVNNDAYIYFYALSQGYFPRYLSDITVWYRSPGSFTDHLKQSSRYRTSYTELRKYFTLDLKHAYAIPLHIIILSTLKYAVIIPQYLIPYLLLHILTRFGKPHSIKSTWSISSSTKFVGA